MSIRFLEAVISGDLVAKCIVDDNTTSIDFNSAQNTTGASMV